MAGFKGWAASIAVVILGVCGVLIAADGASANERALTKAEVTELYEGKSWLWSDGAGYFGSKGRFSATAGTGKKRSTVSGGDWVASGEGRLCFSGVWKASSGRKFDRICFLHKIRDGHIYQKRLPKGEWYVFKHAEGKDGDQRLVPGDQTAK